MSKVIGKQELTVQVYNLDLNNLAAMGYTTEYQQRAVIALADVLTQIRHMKDDFNFMTFLIKEADLLNNRPVEIMTNLPAATQREMFEDYILARLRRREAEEQGTTNA